MKAKYDGLISKDQKIALKPQEWSSSSQAVTRAGAVRQGPCAHNNGATDWLDQSLRRAGEGSAIVLAIDGASGDGQRCILFEQTSTELLYLHVHGDRKGSVLLHNQIDTKTLVGWANGADSHWRHHVDGSLEPLHHQPAMSAPRLGWKNNTLWLVPNGAAEVLRFHEARHSQLCTQRYTPTFQHFPTNLPTLHFFQQVSFT